VLTSLTRLRGRIHVARTRILFVAFISAFQGERDCGNAQAFGGIRDRTGRGMFILLGLGSRGCGILDGSDGRMFSELGTNTGISKDMSPGHG